MATSPVPSPATSTRTTVDGNKSHSNDLQTKQDEADAIARRVAELEARQAARKAAKAAEHQRAAAANTATSEELKNANEKPSSTQTIAPSPGSSSSVSSVPSSAISSPRVGGGGRRKHDPLSPLSQPPHQPHIGTINLPTPLSLESSPPSSTIVSRLRSKGSDIVGSFSSSSSPPISPQPPPDTPMSPGCGRTLSTVQVGIESPRSHNTRTTSQHPTLMSPSSSPIVSPISSPRNAASASSSSSSSGVAPPKTARAPSNRSTTKGSVGLPPSSPLRPTPPPAIVTNMVATSGVLTSPPSNSPAPLTPVPPSSPHPTTTSGLASPRAPLSPPPHVSGGRGGGAGGGGGPVKRHPHALAPLSDHSLSSASPLPPPPPLPPGLGQVSSLGLLLGLKAPLPPPPTTATTTMMTNATTPTIPSSISQPSTSPQLQTPTPVHPSVGLMLLPPPPSALAFPSLPSLFTSRRADGRRQGILIGTGLGGGMDMRTSLAAFRATLGEGARSDSDDDDDDEDEDDDDEKDGESDEKNQPKKTTKRKVVTTPMTGVGGVGTPTTGVMSPKTKPKSVTTTTPSATAAKSAVKVVMKGTKSLPSKDVEEKQQHTPLRPTPPPGGGGRGGLRIGANPSSSPSGVIESSNSSIPLNLPKSSNLLHYVTNEQLCHGTLTHGEITKIFEHYVNSTPPPATAGHNATVNAGGGAAGGGGGVGDPTKLKKDDLLRLSHDLIERLKRYLGEEMRRRQGMNVNAISKNVELEIGTLIKGKNDEERKQQLVLIMISKSGTGGGGSSKTMFLTKSSFFVMWSRLVQELFTIRTDGALGCVIA